MPQKPTHGEGAAWQTRIPGTAEEEKAKVRRAAVPRKPGEEGSASWQTPIPPAGKGSEDKDR